MSSQAVRTQLSLANPDLAGRATERPAGERDGCPTRVSDGTIGALLADLRRDALKAPKRYVVQWEVRGGGE